MLLDNGGGLDSDPDGDPLTVISVVSPGSAGGTVVVNAASDGLEYTPAAGFSGVESFDYTVSDGLGGSDSATVTVTVNPSGTLPNPIAHWTFDEGSGTSRGTVRQTVTPAH